MPGGHANEQVIRCKEAICRNYTGEVSPTVSRIAFATARELGVQDVHFFTTNNTCSFAVDFAFPSIGLAEQEINRAAQGQYNSSNKAVNTAGIQFKHILYHELCHIRGKHTLILSATGNRDKILQLSQEMEAELGALYYLYKIEGFVIFPHYQEDDMHPSRAEHHRYIAHLYHALITNPHIGFDQVVLPLAAHYAQEKRTGIQAVADIISSIKHQLARIGTTSMYVDQWIVHQ